MPGCGCSAGTVPAAIIAASGDVFHCFESLFGTGLAVPVNGVRVCWPRDGVAAAAVADGDSAVVIAGSGGALCDAGTTGVVASFRGTGILGGVVGGLGGTPLGVALFCVPLLAGAFGGDSGSGLPDSDADAADAARMISRSALFQRSAWPGSGATWTSAPPHFALAVIWNASRGGALPACSAAASARSLITRIDASSSEMAPRGASPCSRSSASV
jgi:hypothetical protein